MSQYQFSTIWQILIICKVQIKYFDKFHSSLEGGAPEMDPHAAPITHTTV